MKTISLLTGIIGGFWIVTGTSGCLLRWSVSDSNPTNALKGMTNPDQDFDSEYANETEKNALLMNIQNRMLSVALQFMIDFTIQTGGLEFTCPSEFNGTKGIFGDSLDCQKYYICDSNSTTQANFTTKRCGPGEGFNNVTLSCAPKASVELCQLVEIAPDFACNSTGIHAYEGNCSKFVLCTEEKVAFLSSCNEGNSFDKSLLICLPNVQVNC